MSAEPAYSQGPSLSSTSHPPRSSQSSTVVVSEGYEMSTPRSHGPIPYNSEHPLQGRYSAPPPPTPMHQSLAQQSSPPTSQAVSQTNDNPRGSIQAGTAYRPMSPMSPGGPRSPSLDYSQPPMSPLPPYVACPPPAMQPPHYYQEVHHETQAAAQLAHMDFDERIGGSSIGRGGEPMWASSRGGHNDDEWRLYQSAGQFNPEGHRSRKKRSAYGDKEGTEQGEVCSFLKDMLECCPCFCFCCICFSALN